MKRAIRKILNIVIVVDILIVLGTAMFREDLDYDMYLMMHGIPGLILLLLFAVSVLLNSEWIKKNYFGGK